MASETHASQQTAEPLGGKSTGGKSTGGGGLLHATFWSSISSFANLLSQVVRAKLLAVLLGPPGVAVITQLNSFLIFSQVFGGLGHASGLVRETSQAHADQDVDRMRAVHQAFLFALTWSSCLVAICAIVFADSISDFLFASADYASHVRLTSIAIPLSIGSRYCQSIIRGFRYVSKLAMINTIATTISVTCFVALTFTWGIWGAVVAIVITQLALFSLGVTFVIRSGVELKFVRKIRTDILRRNLSFSVAGIVAGLLGAVAGMYVIRSIIASFGDDLGGLYSATWRLSSVYLGVIFATTTNYFFPTISRMKSRNEIGAEISNTLRLFQIALTPIIVALIIFYEPIIWTLLSDKFYESGRLLAFQLPGDLFRLSFDVFALAILAQGYTKAFTACYLVWFTIYVGGITFAIGHWDQLASVCIAHSCTYILLGLAGYALVPIIFGWKLTPKSFLTMGLAIAHVLAASAIIIVDLDRPIRYCMGLGLIGSWIAIHFNDPAARRVRSKILLAIGR